VKDVEGQFDLQHLSLGPPHHATGRLSDRSVRRHRIERGGLETVGMADDSQDRAPTAGDRAGFDSLLLHRLAQGGGPVAEGQFDLQHLSLGPPHHATGRLFAIEIERGGLETVGMADDSQDRAPTAGDRAGFDSQRLSMFPEVPEHETVAELFLPVK
jgi:hypothetical protein